MHVLYNVVSGCLSFNLTGTQTARTLSSNDQFSFLTRRVVEVLAQAAQGAVGARFLQSSEGQAGWVPGQPELV